MVLLPNGATMESSHAAELDIPKLNAAASKAHVFPGMANHSLLSVGQLCDEGYVVTFKHASVTVCNSQKSQILSGPRDLDTGLWRINLKRDNTHIPEPIANNVYELRNTGALVHYLHKALFSHTKSALLQAVKDGHLITWPGLTEDAIHKHLELTPATAMGHMDQRRQNIRSTSKTPIVNAPTVDTDLGRKTHLVYAVLVDQGKLYTDLTGKFPVRSSKGNSYVMVCYVYDCNYVKVIPIKSRSASEWVKDYDTIHQELTVKGFKSKLQTLDNEALAALKNFFTANDVENQLVLPHCHLRNAAERAMRTFKENFVAGLSSVDPTFTLNLWDRLLPQAEITLNLLRTSRLHPQLSAAAHFHCLVDYNKTAFALSGCKIIAHEKTGKRRTWAPYWKHGYSLGPAMHHYRCQNVYISSTASERIVDTLEFFPHNYLMPQLSSDDILIMSAKDMTDALQNPHLAVPFAHVSDDTIKALANLASIFKLKSRQTSPPTLPAAPPTVKQRTCLVESSNPILAFPMPPPRQTRSQKTVHTHDVTTTPLLPRVATPVTLNPSPPRVPTRSQSLAPRNLSQNDFCGMETAHMAIALGTNHWSQQHQAKAVIHPVTGKEMEYMALMKDPHLQPLWKQGFGNECGRLFEGIRDIPGTDTCLFITLTNIPKYRNITYHKIVWDYKPHKKEKERVRLTVRGDRLDYSGNVATYTADITTFKILINSTLSTEDAAMMMMDIKNYYLGTPLPRFEYMKMLLSRFPEEIVQKYNLNTLAVDGWVYIEIRKGMYGLKQAGLLANQLLHPLLAPFGYYPARHTPGLWLHRTRPISFTLVVDDFAVKYVGKQHAEHLQNALLRTYELTTDWKATVYSGITLKWDYKNRTCYIIMPGYVSNMLSKFQHDSPKHPQHTPSRYATPVYGAKTQYATKDETPPLTARQCLTIQKVTGSVLYYARAVDPTVLMPLNDIAMEQTKATEKTQAATNQLLDYLATHPDATIRYHASDMILHIHSDASYLSVSNARSRLGGLFFLGNKSPEQNTLNGSILNIASVIKNVVASAAKSEVRACFHNAQIIIFGIYFNCAYA
jgi:hypothetical protein